jgi:hypothetical protein
MEEQLELIVVQLSECKRLLELDTAPHLRIALLLVDNVAELVMAKKISNLMYENHHYGQVLTMEDAHPGLWEADKVAEAKTLYLSEKAQRNLERWFDAKIELLVDRGLVAKSLGSGLKWLH